MKGAANKWRPSICSLRPGYPDSENTQCEQYTEAKFKCRRITTDVSLTLNRPHNEIHDHLNQCMHIQTPYHGSAYDMLHLTLSCFGFLYKAGFGFSERKLQAVFLTTVSRHTWFKRWKKEGVQLLFSGLVEYTAHISLSLWINQVPETENSKTAGVLGFHRTEKQVIIYELLCANADPQGQSKR